MNFCNVGEDATVTYLNPDGQKTVFKAKGVIAVDTISNSPGTYRFYGFGDDNVFYQFVATGINPGYSLNSGFNSRGYTPTMNGQFIQSQTYYYVSGFGIEELIKPIEGCKIKIVSGNTFTDTIQCPDGKYSVACGGECPEGFCKCPIPEYPGYCCLDCAATAASIRSITNDLRAKKNG